jgi:Domain of unknown function (DUF4342)
MTTTEMPKVETATEPTDSEKAEECSEFEDMKVAGEELLAKVRELIHEGNVRRVIIKNGEGTVLIEIPLTLGVAGAVILPTLAAVGAIAAIVTDCSITVERRVEAPKA